MNQLVHYVRRVRDVFREHRLGVVTSEWHEQHDTARPDFRGYSPTSYRDWWVIRRHITVSPQSAFIDYGAGLGRVTVLAARMPFTRVIGLELDEGLAERANANLRNARGMIAAAQIVCRNAASFEVPPDATTFYFCNPFAGSVLFAVVDRIRDSLTTHPRLTQLVCNLPESSAFEVEIKGVPWLCLRKTFALYERRKCLIFEAG
jgi:SAM-dependent methyltransferase